MPAVSVIIPFYNRGLYLETSINCILAQTYQDFEILIIDDGSTENVQPVLQKCIAKSPDRIRYYRQENKGSPGARNLWIRKAQGTFVAFLDADDEWHPQIGRAH